MWYNIPMNQDAGSTSIITFRFTGRAPRATKTTMEKKELGKSCTNCYWYEQCRGTERCEYYDPLVTEDRTIKREYELSLRERQEDANEVLSDLETLKKERW